MCPTLEDFKIKCILSRLTKWQSKLHLSNVQLHIMELRFKCLSQHWHLSLLSPPPVPFRCCARSLLVFL